jgi:hypothetical protein
MSFVDQDGHAIEPGWEWWVTKDGEPERNCRFGQLETLTQTQVMFFLGIMIPSLGLVDDMELAVEV